MAVFLIKFMFWALSSLTDLVSFVIFKGGAYLLILAIQGLRAPGQGISTLLEYAANIVKAVFEYLLELLMDAVSSLISSAFDLLIEAISGSISSTGSAVGDLVGKTKSALEELVKVLPEVMEDASETTWTMVMSLWNNYKDAIGFILDNI